MSASNPGFGAPVLPRLWRVVDVSRRVVLNLLFLCILIAALVGLRHERPGAARRQDRAGAATSTARSVEQTAATARDARSTACAASALQKVQLRDVLTVLDAAAKDPKITSVRADPRRDRRRGPGDAARDRRARSSASRPSGKQVVAWGSGYDQRQYYVAAHADEVYLHPMGMVYVEGFGRLRNYYHDALDKLGVTVNLMRVGTYKSFGEPFIANGPSPAAIEADSAALRRPVDSLHRRGREGAQARRRQRRCAASTSCRSGSPRRAATCAKLALADKLVDALKTRDELRAMMIERGAEDDDAEDLPPGHLRRLPGARSSRASTATRSAWSSPKARSSTARRRPGAIGGLSTADLIRKARDDEHVKALVLRVDSPGGSVFGSELIRRELELTRAAGKPVVVSMGNLAASGGYWIATASDEIIADAATDHRLDRRVRAAADAPSRRSTSSACTPPASHHLAAQRRRPAPCRSTRASPTLIQSSVDHIYLEFIDQGRGGAQEHAGEDRRGGAGPRLDRRAGEGARPGRPIGQFGDALRSAAKRAKLGDKPRIVYIEREPGRFAQLVSMLNAAGRGLVGAEIDAAHRRGRRRRAAARARRGARPRLGRRDRRAQEAVRRGRPLSLRRAN